MKKIGVLCVLLSFLAVLLLFASCERDPFSNDVTGRFFSDFLKYPQGEDEKILSLDAYFYENYYYYNARYTYTDSETGELTEINGVFRGGVYSPSFSLYINLNWKEWGDALVMKDRYYDAVEYGKHKSFTSEEIEKYISEANGS